MPLAVSDAALKSPGVMIMSAPVVPTVLIAIRVFTPFRALAPRQAVSAQAAEALIIAVAQGDAVGIAGAADDTLLEPHTGTAGRAAAVNDVDPGQTKDAVIAGIILGQIRKNVVRTG